VLLVASALSVSAISGPNLASSSAGIRETLVLVGAVLITTGIVLHTLNFRIKELHSVLTRKAFRSR